VPDGVYLKALVDRDIRDLTTTLEPPPPVPISRETGWGL
jgi:hypothetical protein